MRRRPFLAMFTLLAAVACGPAQGSSTDMRIWTDDFQIRVSTQPSPPTAREAVIYKVVVRDKETGEPIENGEGRVFATSRDGANTWDSLEPTAESGAYTAKLRFITAGDWAVAIQFRRDSASRLQRQDWMQTIHNERQ
jgi:hypothetical protein